MARPTWRLRHRARHIPAWHRSLHPAAPPARHRSPRPRHLPGIKAGLPSRVLNPVVTPGLRPSILLSLQDCALQSCCHPRIAPFNPVVTPGLRPSILLSPQDCALQSWANNRIAPPPIRPAFGPTKLLKGVDLAHKPLAAGVDVDLGHLTEAVGRAPVLNLNRASRLMVSVKS